MKRTVYQIVLIIIFFISLWSCATITPEERAQILDNTKRVKLSVEAISFLKSIVSSDSTSISTHTEAMPSESNPQLKYDTEKQLAEVITYELQKSGYMVSEADSDIKLLAKYKEILGAKPANSDWRETGRLSFYVTNTFDLELKLVHDQFGTLYETRISSDFTSIQDLRNGTMEIIRTRMKDILPFK